MSSIFSCLLKVMLGFEYIPFSISRRRLSIFVSISLTFSMLSLRRLSS